VFQFGPTDTIASEIDLRRRRFPPPGPNPSNSIPLMSRGESFPLGADSSVSARVRLAAEARMLGATCVSVPRSSFLALCSDDQARHLAEIQAGEPAG